ncbi:MAG TPA: methyl-accepting chemotaxis protein [Spirochaetota bacterium]|nr:methyl-accepting chemotaxis protein [Spirochaetota bacterium]
MASLNHEKLSRLGLRTRVAIIVFVLISAICIGITLTSYIMLKKQLFTELRARLTNIAYTGSFMIDRKSLAGIVSSLAPGYDYTKVDGAEEYPLEEEVISGIESAPEFERVCSDLNLIRDAQPDLLIYAYIVIPTAEPGMLRFVADADAPELLAEAKETGGSMDEITRYSKLYEAGPDSVMAGAADKKLNVADTEFAWDEEGRFNIVSGYAPVFDEGVYLGMLGIDISDKNASAILKKTMVIYILISFAAVIAAVLLSLFISRMISVPLGRLVSSLHDMAEGEGNLTGGLPVTTNDELGRAAFEFNRFTGRLRDVISEIKIISVDLDSASVAIRNSMNGLSDNLVKQTGLEREVFEGGTHIKSSVEMLAKNADVQADGFTSLTNRLVDLSNSISALADESKLASKLTETITGNVIKGKDSLQSASSIMASIGKSSEEMTGIAGIISDISDQINLLSLNAAIESARAGDAGRGFAVVADEISKLADKTAYNVKDIDRIIRDNSLLISQGMLSVNSMIGLFSDVITDVSSISALIQKITTYMNEQSGYNDKVHKESETMKSVITDIHELVEEHERVVDSIADSLGSISRLSQGNMDASLAVNTSAGEITAMTDNLINLMNYFKVGTGNWQ